VRCPGCQHTNREQARFCEQCGTKLGQVSCNRCGAALGSTAKFCDSCGTVVTPVASAGRATADPRSYTPKHLADRILSQRSALEGERKQVTVLFADIKGSMEAAEQVDAEAWHRIMDRLFTTMTAAVHGFEGTVNQYTGDGVMALFGAPIAHEDHAQRACYAALRLRSDLQATAHELKREHGVTLSTRIGLHSGEVVVGKIGDDLRMDYTAQGHTVGLASRMEQLASPDTIYVSAETAGRVTGYFELTDLGKFRIKGVSEAMGVFELEGVGRIVTRFDASRARGLTRFVGRDSDLRTLEAVLEEVLAGRGHVVGVVGEAGVGKSRLCFEFVERARARGLRVLHGSGLPHGKNIPLLPILDVFRQYYGISEQDDPRTAREKIAGRLLLIDERFRELLPVLFDFFGTPDPDRPAPVMSPEARHRQIFGVLRAVVEHRDPHAPATIVLIEDLHWIDPATETFVEQWAEAVVASRVLLLLNFRPEYHAGWMSKSYYRQIPVAPLGKEAIDEMLRGLLGNDPSLAGLAESIHSHTAGNPFFIEEIVRSLAEAGTLRGGPGAYRLATPLGKLAIPHSVQAILAARIDRLSAELKQLLQTAAVIGIAFEEPVLRAACELDEQAITAALAHLRQAEFVYERSLYPVAEYAFKHPLTQEVALQSQLSDVRAAAHARVAQAVEATAGDRLDERAALVAHHWDEAGQRAVALRWYVRAADWLGTRDPAEHTRLWQRVATLASAVENDSEITRLRLRACRQILVIGSWRMGVARDEAERLYAEGRELAKSSGDTDTLIELIGGYGARLVTAGESVDRYIALGHDAAALVTPRTSKECRASACMTLTYAYYVGGLLEQAADHCRQMFEAVEGDHAIGLARFGFSLAQWAQLQLAINQVWQGQVESARQILLTWAPQIQKSGSPESLAWILTTVPAIAFVRGESAVPGIGDARASALKAYELAERYGSHYTRTLTLRGLGMAHLAHRSWTDAIDAFESARNLVREHGTGREHIAWAMGFLALAQIGAGKVDEAYATAQESLATARRASYRLGAILSSLALAEAVRAGATKGTTELADRAIGEALASIDETGAHALAPQLLEVQARLALAGGQREQAARQAAAAHKAYLALGAPVRAAAVAKLIEDQR
jgi:class 3 adenylate cyclase/tetratricopeptide (TPR) repeat protein